MWNCCPGWDQPDPSNDDGQQRGPSQQHPVSAVIRTSMTCSMADDRSKDSHGRHGSSAERGDVRHSGHACRKRECGDHAKKMRTARNTMQHAKTERGVRMAHTANPAWSCLDVQMIVLHRAVDVRCRRQVHAASERPYADDDERSSDEAFAPA